MSTKHVWMCVGVITVALGLGVVTGVGAFLLVPIACVVMIGAMMWMMMGARRPRS